MDNWTNTPEAIGAQARALESTKPAKLSLWDIESALNDLLDAREEADTPEAIAACDQALAEYAEREVRKVDDIRSVVKQCEMLAEAARREARDQEARAQRFERRRERVLEMVKSAMEAHGTKRIEGRTGSLRLKGNGGLAPLEVTNPDEVPIECVRFQGWISGRLWSDILVRNWWMDRKVQGVDFKLEKVVDNGATRLKIAEEGGVPGARLGERGTHVEVK